MVEIETRKAEIPAPKKPNILKRFIGLFQRKDNTPREQEAVKSYEQTRGNTRKALSSLAENTETSRRNKIEELRKIVIKTPDISRDKVATRAYQELILLTNPERFQREISIIDGTYGPKTQKAYEQDKALLNSKPKNWLQRLFSRTPESEEKKQDTQTKKQETSTSEEKKKSPSPELAKGTVGGGSIKSSPYEKSKKGVTLCSGTARKNLYKFVPSVPIGDADEVAKIYRNGGRYPNMLGFSSGEFNPPEGANVVDLLINTPQLPHYKRDYNHRSVAYKENGTWYALDPYYGRSGTEPIPLVQYLARFNRPGYGFAGAAYYNSSRIG